MYDEHFWFEWFYIRSANTVYLYGLNSRVYKKTYLVCYSLTNYHNYKRIYKESSHAIIKKKKKTARSKHEKSNSSLRPSFKSFILPELAD